MNKLFKDYHRIVIKIGSSLLVEDQKIREKWLNKFVKDIANLIEKKHEIIIVTSGAVALGRSILFNDNFLKLTLADKQAEELNAQADWWADFYSRGGTIL